MQILAARRLPTVFGRLTLARLFEVDCHAVGRELLGSVDQSRFKDPHNRLPANARIRSDTRSCSCDRLSPSRLDSLVYGASRRPWRVLEVLITYVAVPDRSDS